MSAHMRSPRFVSFSAEKSDWLYGKLWMGDHPFVGQLLVVRLHPESASTKGYSLETTWHGSVLTMYRPARVVDSNKSLYLCKATVGRGDTEIFQEENDLGPNTAGSRLRRAPSEESFSPSSLLYNYSQEANPFLAKHFGQDRFTLESDSVSHTYFAVDPILFTPDENHKYRGVWVCFYPEVGCELFLFHQETESRLEIIKLTGDRHVPRGAHSIIAHDLSQVKRIYSDLEWQNVSIVDARIQVASEEYAEHDFIDAELLLLSFSEIVVLVQDQALQMKRVPTDQLISGGQLTVLDCCLCENLAKTQLPASILEGVAASQRGPKLPIRGSGPSVYHGPAKKTIVEDAEVLGLDRREPHLSAFKSPLNEDGMKALYERADGNCTLHELCICCKNYFAQVELVRNPSASLLPPQSQHRLHANFDGLRRSVAEGCHFCSMILYNLDRLGMLADATNTTAEKGVYLFYSCFQGRSRERVVWTYEKDKPVPLFEKPTIYLSVFPTGDDVSTFIKPGVEPKGYVKFSPAITNDSEPHPSSVPHEALSNMVTSSPQHMDLGRAWVSQCLAHHQGCKPGSASFKPTRLLYVGDTSLRLHLTENDAHSVKYCCLSHCWGGVTDIPQLKADISTLVAGIDIATLPRSFQDAVLITRQLGVDYVWIDCLCIIQGSLEDWTTEVAVMGKVFEHAYCTIALAEAKTPHDGAFVRRDPRTSTPVRIARVIGGELLLQPPNTQKGFAGGPDDSLSSHTVWMSKLLSRGWVFQEALLSTRVLYFGRGLFWTCRQGQASDMDPTGRGLVVQGTMYGASDEAIFPALNPGYRHRDSEKTAKEKRGTRRGKKGESQTAQSEVMDMFFRGRPNAGNAPGRSEYESLLELSAHGPTKRTTLDYQFHQYWIRLLGLYTRLDLTVEDDRLPALGGIAQNVMKPGWRYLAGLWEPFLPFDLLWTTTSYEKPLSPRPTGNQNPTWSWASVSATVGTNLNTMDESGRSKTTVLIKLISAKTECHTSDPSKTGLVFSGELIIDGMLIPCSAGEEGILEDFPLKDDEGKKLGELTPDCKPPGIESGKVFVLPVLRIADKDGRSDKPEVVYHGIGLVEKDNHFERVGYTSYCCDPGEALQLTKYMSSKKRITIK